MHSISESKGSTDVELGKVTFILGKKLAKIQHSELTSSSM